VSPDTERERDGEMERRRRYADTSLRRGASPSGSTRPPSSQDSHLHSHDHASASQSHNHERHRPVLPPLSDLYKPPYNASRPSSRRSRADNSRGEGTSPVEANVGAGNGASAETSKEVYCASPIGIDVDARHPSPSLASARPASESASRPAPPGRHPSPQAGHRVSPPPQSMHRTSTPQGAFSMTPPPRPSRRNGNEGVQERCFLKKRDRSEFERDSGSADVGGDRNLKRRLSTPEGDGGDGGVKAEEGEDEPVWPKLRPVRDFENLSQDCDSSSGSSVQADPLPLPLPAKGYERDQSPSRRMSQQSGTGREEDTSTPPPSTTAATSRSVERAPLKSTSTNVRVRAPVRNKLGINHMDLLYETRQDKMVCRMCWYVILQASRFIFIYF
jgi:hypothetical protein